MGVFQRLWTQNQSCGELRIFDSRATLRAAVASSMSGGASSLGLMIMRQRPGASVTTETGRMGAPVLRLRRAARLVVEASLPKSGDHWPASPAC